MPDIIYSDKPYGYKKYDVVVDYITFGDYHNDNTDEDEKDYFIPMFMSYGLTKKKKGKSMPVYKQLIIQDEYQLKIWLDDLVECLKTIYPIKTEQINTYVLRKHKKVIKTTKGKRPWVNIPHKEAIEEAMSINLFKECRALERFKHQSDFQMGRYLLFSAIIDMVRFDPACGDIKEVMTKEEEKHWVGIRKKMRDAGILLNKKNEMKDDLVWLFIPRRFWRDIEYQWDGIGDWRK